MTSLTTGRARRGLNGPQALLMVLSANMLLDALEVSTIFVAMPAIARELGLGPHTAHWLQGSFAIGFGCLVPYGGRLAALLGRRRAYLVAVGLFAAASAGAAVTTAVVVVIAMRALKGGCVALTAPTGLAIISDLFSEGPARQRAVRVYATCGAAGLALGAAISGVLTEFDWRYALAFPAPAALILGWGAARIIPTDVRPAARSGRLSISSLPVAVAGTALLVASAGGGPGARWLTGLAGAALLVLWTRRLERLATARVARLLRVPGYWRSVCGAALLNGTFWGLLLVLTVLTQTRGGWPPGAAALLVVLASAVALVLTLKAAGLQRRFGLERPIAAGFLLTAAGCAQCLLPPATRLQPLALAGAMLLVGAGFGLSFGALHMQAMRWSTPADRGRAVAAYQAAVQIGGAVLLAATAALMPDPTGSGGYPAGAVRFVTGCALIGLTVALSGLRGHRRTEETI